MPKAKIVVQDEEVVPSVDTGHQSVDSEPASQDSSVVIPNGQFQSVREGKGFRVYGKLGQAVSPVISEEAATELARRFNNIR